MHSDYAVGIEACRRALGETRISLGDALSFYATVSSLGVGPFVARVPRQLIQRIAASQDNFLRCCDRVEVLLLESYGKANGYVPDVIVEDSSVRGDPDTGVEDSAAKRLKLDESQHNVDELQSKGDESQAKVDESPASVVVRDENEHESEHNDHESNMQQGSIPESSVHPNVNPLQDLSALLHNVAGPETVSNALSGLDKEGSSSEPAHEGLFSMLQSDPEAAFSNILNTASSDGTASDWLSLLTGGN